MTPFSNALRFILSAFFASVIITRGYTAFHKYVPKNGIAVYVVVEKTFT
jgi:hypothetical protein